MKRIHSFPLPLFLLLAWLGGGAWQSALAKEVAPLATELRLLLQQPPPDGDSLFNWGELTTFYTAEKYQPVWLGPAGPNTRAALLRERLLRAAEEGLVPRHYRTEFIEQIWLSEEVADRLRLELLLSSAFFDYVRDIRGGRLDPQQVSPLWKIARPEVDTVTMLRLALLAGDFRDALDALPPSHPAYHRLREALARYRRIAALGGWPVIPSGPALESGMHDSRIALLRHRLMVEGDLTLPASSDERRFDRQLRYAVERFQVRHGLKVDGVVGRQTLKALNVPVGARIEQLRINMERWRWLPQRLGGRYIIVNIPAYELIAYDNDEAQLSMPVIIGTRERRTPVIAGRLHTVVFNPYWTVPRNIALRDVIPRQRRNPNYMPSYRIRVFADWNGGAELDPKQIDWRGVNANYLPYMLRQDPGPKNPLGHTKFLFTNPYSVYLHDTPDESLFADSVRAFSSGCVRVEEPLRLARFVLADEGGWRWDEKMVRAVINKGSTHEIPLSTPMQVYLLYLTAWVSEDGAVYFRNDIYGEDGLLEVCMP